MKNGCFLLAPRFWCFVTLSLVVAVGGKGVSRAYAQGRADANAAPVAGGGTLLIQGGTVIDGTGAKRKKADVRVVNGEISQIGRLKPGKNERVIDATGLIVAPGFIDTHSHADGGLMDNPDTESQIRQGITTAIIGQDGGSHVPLGDYLDEVQAKHVALNIASFVGHGSIRSAVMGQDYKRASTPEEEAKMEALVEMEMQSGALGLSSGLEYDPGLYAKTEEVIDCAKIAARYGGIYISHVRDEENEALTSIRELIDIADKARIAAQISHIKLGSSNVWGKADEALRLMADANKRGIDVTADVYPYTYWRSTITVITPTRDWNDRAAWQKGLDEIGGPANVLLSIYTPAANWQGKTLEKIAQETGRDAVTIIQEIVKNTHGEGATGREGVVVTAMKEDDLRRFIASPGVMFCTDGGLGSSHPRGAGTYPRILGRYVREEHVLTLEDAIRKMTLLPAARMGFDDRGALIVGMKADIVLFDADKIIDTATTAEPTAAPIGLSTVIVNGVPVLDNGKMTGQRPGMALRRSWLAEK